MRRMHYLCGLLLIVCAMSLQSCNNDDVIIDPPVNYPNALVTVKNDTSYGCQYFAFCR